jgi:hypothetical protein
MSLRCRVERARKKATLGSISDEEVVLINEYKPATKPGFCWDHEGYMRSMCVNCIFEASFDFAAKLRLGLYNEDNAADAEDNAVDAEDITVDGAPGDRLMTTISTVTLHPSPASPATALLKYLQSIYTCRIR